MVVRTKPICDVCGNRHTIHEDGFEILDCILYLKNKETETEMSKCKICKKKLKGKMLFYPTRCLSCVIDLYCKRKE
jgi:hypothetical protein